MLVELFIRFVDFYARGTIWVGNVTEAEVMEGTEVDGGVCDVCVSRLTLYQRGSR